MRLIVNPHKIELIQEEAVNEKEIDVSKCEFEFADEITDDFVKEAYFTLGDETYKQIIVNNKCSFPQEVLVRPATIELGVVAYKTDDETEIKRYNPTPVYFKTDLGSLKDAENSQPITPSEMEQYEQALQDGLSEVDDKLGAMDIALGEVDNLDIDASKSGTVSTVTITNKAGTTKTVQILDGINGTNGVDGKDGRDGIDGKDGKDGTNGTDGISPIATVSKSNGTATITITDKNGTTTTTVSDGINGTNGTNGRDGYVQYTAGSNITIEDNVISATGGASYTAGDGISIDANNKISSTMPITLVTTYNNNNPFVIENNTPGLYFFAYTGSTVPITGYSGGTKVNFTINDGFIIITNNVIDKTSATYQTVGYIYGSTADSYSKATINYCGTLSVYGTSGKPAMNTYSQQASVPISGNVDIYNKKTFNELPECSATVSSNNQLTNKKYVDNAISNKIWIGTQAEYDTLSSYSDDTLYFIKET